MVRFKNRYLIVEFLQPSTSTPQLEFKPLPIEQEEEEEEEEDEGEEDELTRIPIIPFLLPPIPDLKNLKDGEEGGKGIYKAVRGMVQDVFGDEGWGRISSSFRSKSSFPVRHGDGELIIVIYHSPLTSMTLIRIARPHIRILHAAITLLTTIDGRAVLPRVVGVSGTVKKAQGRIMVYHRAVIAQMLARFDEGEPTPDMSVSRLTIGINMSTAREKGELEKRAEAERNVLGTLED
jgi:ribonuclease P/MRP protein subunit POP5